ncbi:hypothetical protein [Nocardia tengchongensis]|uniref:hypothetical protein n=1 Tax=Nocardia tengchongensis TaxID=2055889 RepID=UPI00367962B0
MPLTRVGDNDGQLFLRLGRAVKAALCAMLTVAGVKAVAPGRLEGFTFLGKATGCVYGNGTYTPPAA